MTPRTVKLVRLEDVLEVIDDTRGIGMMGPIEAAGFVARLKALSDAGGDDNPSMPCETHEWLREQVDQALEMLGVARAKRHNGDRMTILGAAIMRQQRQVAALRAALVEARFAIKKWTNCGAGVNDQAVLAADLKAIDEAIKETNNAAQ